MVKTIPNGSTPIKNEILIEIFAKGLLTNSELRIISYIIRWSWGFENKKNNRRQDWTNPLTIKKIAEDIKMDYTWCSRITKTLIKTNKLFCQNNRYQFNEHYDQWKVEENSTVEEN